LLFLISGHSLFTCNFWLFCFIAWIFLIFNFFFIFTTILFFIIIFILLFSFCFFLGFSFYR
jgi:hypothetical protein